MNKVKDQKGFGVVEVLLIVFTIASLAGLGWYVWSQNKDEPTSNASTQPDTSQEASEPEEPQPEQTAYLTITEMGVKIPLTENTKDAYYEVENGFVYLKVDLAGDTEKACSEQAALAKVDNHSEEAENWRQRTSELEKVGSKIGDSYYFIEGSQSPCTEDEALQEQASTIRADWLKQGKLIVAAQD